MSSEASSDQLCVHEGAAYNEVYPLGQDDPGTFYDDTHLLRWRMRTSTWTGQRVTQTTRITQSIIGPDGFRQFILLSLWTVNNFNSNIRKKHFDTLREKYQILVSIPIYLLFRFEKC